MESRLKFILVLVVIILFKGSDRLLHLITNLYTKKSKPVIKYTSEALQNSYSKEISVAKNLMAQLLLEKWNFEMEQSGVKVFLKLGSDKINTFRGDGKFDRTYSLQEIISVIKSPSARKEWDGRYAEGKIIESHGNSFITHSSQKGTFPFAAREFSTIGQVELQDNHASLVSTSITHPNIAYDQVKVRGNLYLGGWDIRKTANSLEISYIVQVDVGGYIPPALLKSIQTQSPLCIAAVIKYLDESGPLPFIIHKNDDSGIRILKEEFNSNKSYNLTIRNELPKSGSFLIALPSKRFQGAKIQISGHDSYKLDKNDSNYSQWISSASGYVLSVTSLPSQEVTIEISPGSQGFIINGSIASQGIRKPDLTKLSGVQNTQIISILSPTLESAEKILERVDESWDNAVDRVAGSINHSRSLARKGASKIVTLAKLILFH